MAESKSTATAPERAPNQRAEALDRTGGQRGAIERREPFSSSSFASPFQMMRRMSEEMDRVFERVFGDLGFGAPSAPRGWFTEGGREAIWSPRVEALQKGDKFIVRAELPGLSREDVQVHVTQEGVTIQGQRRQEHEERREGFYHSERSYGSFHRTIPLPEGAIVDSAEASFRDGLLEITMQVPPSEVSRGRRVEIKDASSGAREKK
jgi:HSP20 family protein